MCTLRNNGGSRRENDALSGPSPAARSVRKVGITMRAVAVFCPVFFAVPTWLPISVAQQDAEDARKLYAKGVDLLATNVDMSITFFSKAIAIDNRFTAAYVKRGDAFWRKKEFSNALKDVTRA